MPRLLLLAAAGAVGTLARYGVGRLLQRTAGVTFPWGTLAVNLAGCFLAGVLFTALASRAGLNGEAQMLVLVGFMGAFTTFSALMLDVGQMVAATRWLRAGLTLLLHNAVGLALMLAGLALGRQL